MNETAKRERVKEVVRTQIQIRAEIERLNAQSSSLDVELDRLLHGTSSGSSAKPTVSPPKAAAPAARKAAPAAKKPAAAKPVAKSSAPAAKPTAKPAAKPAAKGKVGAVKGTAEVSVAAPGSAALAKAAKAPGPKKAKGKKRGNKAAPTIKDKMLGALRASPDGVDVSVLARDIYGGDDTATRTRCEQYLYNLAKQRIVTHVGPRWQLAARSA